MPRAASSVGDALRPLGRRVLQDDRRVVTRGSLPNRAAALQSKSCSPEIGCRKRTDARVQVQPPVAVRGAAPAAPYCRVADDRHGPRRPGARAPGACGPRTAARAAAPSPRAARPPPTPSRPRSGCRPPPTRTRAPRRPTRPIGAVSMPASGGRARPPRRGRSSRSRRRSARRAARARRAALRAAISTPLVPASRRWTRPPSRGSGDAAAHSGKRAHDRVGGGAAAGRARAGATACPPAWRSRPAPSSSCSTVTATRGSGAIGTRAARRSGRRQRRVVDLERRARLARPSLAPLRGRRPSMRTAPAAAAAARPRRSARGRPPATA